MSSYTMDGELPEGAVAPLEMQDDYQLDALDVIDKRTWNKRKLTGEEAANKRAAFVAPAGQGTAQSGIVRPRNNEVLEMPLSGSAVAKEALPNHLKLVVTAAEARTKNVPNIETCVVEWLEMLEDDECQLAAAESLPAALRHLCGGRMRAAGRARHGRRLRGLGRGGV